MKRPTTLLCRVLLNEGLQASLAVERDFRTIESRYEDEGMSFLTITLPSLDDALIQGLHQGFLTPSMFNGFKPFKRGGKLPAFMHGFFRNVFEIDGWLKETPCIDSIRAIRQVTRLFKKVELPCSEARQRQAYERYVSNDQSISGCLDSDPSNVRNFDIVSSYLWSDLEVLSGALYCAPGKFGSGATSERLAFNERHSITTWPERGDENFPSSYHTTVNEGDVESLLGLTFLTETEEEPVRVVQVPKTLKTPRTISVEPSYMMLRQQSIAGPIMAILEQGLLGFKSIRFTDQSVNRELARKGSLDGSLSTIDLSDASDLVSLKLVERIFKDCPSFLEYLLGARSTRAVLPDASKITLKKYASMGSALCFPVEAMVFFTLVITSMVNQSGRRPSRKLLEQLTAKVAVYGDDIIVPTETADGVMETLEAYGLRVNHNKSFTKGFFRESCGGDYYKGHDVTPVYVRQWTNSITTREPRMLEACVSLSNQLYMKGLWHASQYIRDSVERQVGRLARTIRPVGCLTWSSLCFNSGLEYHTPTSGYAVRGYSTRSKRRNDPVLDLRGGLLVAFGPQDYILGKSRFVKDGRSTLERLKSLSNRVPDSPAYAGTEGNSQGLPFSLAENVGRSQESVGNLSECRFSQSATWLHERDLHSQGTNTDPRARHIPRSWEEEFDSSRKRRFDSISQPRDLMTSTRPYALKTKRRLVPVFMTGLHW